MHCVCLFCVTAYKVPKNIHCYIGFRSIFSALGGGYLHYGVECCNMWNSQKSTISNTSYFILPCFTSFHTNSNNEFSPIFHVSGPFNRILQVLFIYLFVIFILFLLALLYLAVILSVLSSIILFRSDIETSYQSIEESANEKKRKKKLAFLWNLP